MGMLREDALIKEAARYMGISGNANLDTRIYELLKSALYAIVREAEPKSLHAVYDIERYESFGMRIGKADIKSSDLSKNLSGCEKTVIFAATLGAAIDRLMARASVTDMANAACVNACAAAYLENYCDEVNERIKDELDDGFCLKPRFSPGYGDFQAAHQKDILDMLEAPKKIGLTVTDGCMLAPTKSVTALIGIYKV